MAGCLRSASRRNADLTSRSGSRTGRRTLAEAMPSSSPNSNSTGAGSPTASSASIGSTRPARNASADCG